MKLCYIVAYLEALLEHFIKCDVGEERGPGKGTEERPSLMPSQTLVKIQPSVPYVESFLNFNVL